MRHWGYASCTPWCGLDANGKWQATQEVANLDLKGMNSLLLKHRPCTANGAKGPTVQNPVNKNKDGNVPPGWPAGDPGGQ